jgi:beta-lactamase regulating signal transducer with metallopeptidase domain
MTDRWLALLADSSIRALVIAAAVALILAVFRIRNSSTRHTAWAVVVMTMLMMPMLVRVVPPVRVQFPDSLPSMVPMPAPARIDVPVRSLDPSSAVIGERIAPSSSITAPAADFAGPVDRSVPPLGMRWTVLALSVYLTGVVLLLARWVAGLVQLSKIRKCSRSVETANIQVFESALVAVPVTVGLLRPRVILPLGWREWAADTLTAVLAHERAHVERRDPLVTAIAHLNCAIFWFHPVAWWLETRLATLAEHACDDAALKLVARRQYADTLLDIAATVRRHNGRLAWQGVGVDGDGRLGQRIDRVLSGASWPVTSRTRRALVGTSCAVVIGIAVACRQETKVEPLRENPQLAAELKSRRDQQTSYEAARTMSLAEAAALERELERNPDDMAIRGKLLTFYQWTGKNTQSWIDNVAARRRHALWLVEHYPHSSLVMQAPVTKESDPEGYAQLRKRWLALTAPANVGVDTLSNAAWFFALPPGHPNRPAVQPDMTIAEELLLRALKIQPRNSMFAFRIGDLYGSALAPQTATADPTLAAWARHRLDQITDPDILFGIGQQLVWRSRARELGRSYIERASRMNGSGAERARAWLRRTALERDEAFPFNGQPGSEWPAIVEKSTGIIKLRQLAAIAGNEYGMAEYYDWHAKQPADGENTKPHGEQDKQTAAEGFANAKKYAREAIDLAPTIEGPGAGEAAFNARITYGLALLREGNRKGAVEQMQAAAKLPAPRGQAIGLWASGFEYKLVFYLLKNGERQTVIDYFEQAAQNRDPGRQTVMRASAAAIRNGRMPEHYQQLWLPAASEGPAKAGHYKEVRLKADTTRG